MPFKHHRHSFNEVHKLLFSEDLRAGFQLCGMSRLGAYRVCGIVPNRTKHLRNEALVCAAGL